jgi:hypothetical protein
MIAQLPNPSSYVAMGWVLTALIALGGGYFLVLRIVLAHKQLKAPPLPTGQQPQPFVVQEAEVFVKMPDFNQKVAELSEEIVEVEKRLDKKFEKTESIFRDRFHKLDSDLEGISKMAQNNSEIATEQFQKIEGRLGELKSTTEHTNAMAIRTDQASPRWPKIYPTKLRTRSIAVAEPNDEIHDT